MASQAKITDALPDTLPEDFVEWDGGESPAAQPAAPGKTEAKPASNGGAKPAARPAETPAASLKPAADLLHGAPLPKPTKDYTDEGAFLNRVKSLKPAVDRMHDAPPPRKHASSTVVEDVPAAPTRPNNTANGTRRTPAAQAAAMSEADEVLFHTFRSGAAAETKAQKPAKKKWTMFAVAGGVPVLLLFLLAIPMLRHGKSTTPQQQPTATAIQPEVTVADDEPSATAAVAKPSPSAATPSAPDKRAAVSNTQDTSDAKPAATDQVAANSPHVQSQMMNEQLNAPTRIQHTDTNTADAPPPPSSSFAAAGLGGNAAMGNVFGGSQGPKVQVATPSIVRVSAGVAVGLLVQKTAPVYPLIAKTARVSGTVVLQATISKTGAIENLHVESGPVMLRDAAMDAVRTWRYKPYKLNNEPVEIETTINVIFSLAG